MMNLVLAEEGAGGLREELKGMRNGGEGYKISHRTKEKLIAILLRSHKNLRIRVFILSSVIYTTQ